MSTTMTMHDRMGWRVALLIAGVGLAACSSESDDTGTGGAGGSGGAVSPDGAADTGVDGTADAADATADASDADAAACVLPELADCTGLAPIAMADVCTALSDAFCALYARCGYVSAAEMDGCKAVLAAGCNAPTAGVDAGRSTYDGAQAACCIKRIKQDDSCDVGMSAFSYDPTCKTIFLGKVPVGGDCYSNGDCAGNARCNATTCPGKCESQIVISTGADLCLGAPCSVIGQPCATGLVCVVTGDAGASTCQFPPKLGESCDVDTAACDGKSTCDFDFDAGTAKCVAPKTGGGSCYYDANCATGFYCRGGSFTNKVAGTCTATTALGAACDPTNSFACGRLYTCQAGTTTCGSDPRKGEPCRMSYDTCIDSYCVATGDAGLGTCAALLPGGADCEGYWQCASGVCRLVPSADGGTDGGADASADSGEDASTDGSEDASTDGSEDGATEGGTDGGAKLVAKCTDPCKPPP
jgi:hypothetical protein